MPDLRKRFSGLWTDESGISSVEYALLMVFIGGAVIVGAQELSSAVENKILDTATCIQTDGVTC